ncbi:MAG: PTS sugar transporter subunit IIB [Culicoidibacterales bacterium]
MEILIICSGGLSTELISQKLNVLGGDEKYNFTAIDIESAKEVLANYDGVMITPQTKFIYQEIAKLCADTSTKVFQIPFVLYTPNPSSIDKLYKEIKSFF